MWARQARAREGEKQVATRSNRRRKSLESSNVIIINLHAFQYRGKPRFILIIVHFFSYSRSTLIGGRGLQEGEGDGEGGSLDRELRARGQRQPDLLDLESPMKLAARLDGGSSIASIFLSFPSTRTSLLFLSLALSLRLEHSRDIKRDNFRDGHSSSDFYRTTEIRISSSFSSLSSLYLQFPLSLSETCLISRPHCPPEAGRAVR